jgi:hypothetical protein
MNAFKPFKSFNRFAEPVLSVVEWFHPPLPRDAREDNEGFGRFERLKRFNLPRS